MKQRIFLDPDGTWPEWIGVIVESPTGVVYCHQCAGLLNDQRALEGFYVPLGGRLVDADDEVISSARLTRIFHRSGSCGSGRPLKDRWFEELTKEVCRLPFWWQDKDGTDHRGNLFIKESSKVDAVEAWVPVETPLGRGVLVWGNCD